jgi:hypothetical protein
MAVNIVQNPDISMGLRGTDSDHGQFVFVTFKYTATTPANSTVFVAPRRLVLKGVMLRPDVAGTDAGAVTANVVRAPSGTAIASGTTLITGTGNLKGTAATNQAIALTATAANLDIPAGTAVGVLLAGILTSAQGSITLAFCPA